MERISLNDLPSWSPWPARLLGLDAWQIPERTIAKIQAEYDQDKYAKCLAYHQTAEDDRTPSPEEVHVFECGPPDREIACSFDNEIFRVTLGEAQRKARELIREAMSAAVAQADTVVELGCGYGIQLWHLRQAFPEKSFIGGEYSRNALELAGRLYEGVRNIEVCEFNFYDDRYDVVLGERITGRAVVFTCHALGQLPTARPFLDTLEKHAENISCVFHFEPVVGLQDDSLLGLMRKRYARINDYNRDLLELLERKANVHILRKTPDAIGTNPLTPTSIIEWEYR